MSQNLTNILKAARQLPVKEQRQLAEQLLKQSDTNERLDSEARKRNALSIVNETYGSIKGLKRATLIRLAESEEFCGY